MSKNRSNTRFLSIKSILSILGRIFFILLFALSPVAQAMPVQAAPVGQDERSAPPAAPAGLTAATLDGAVRLDWQPNSEADLAGYNLYRGTASGAYDLVPLNGSALLTEPTYLDAGLENGVTYFYVVTAASPAGESAFSQEASAAPQAAPLKETGRQPADEEIALYADDPITPMATAAWTAYNDCQTISGQPTTNITSVTCHVAHTTATSLVKYSDGLASGATVTVAISGTVDQQTTTNPGTLPTGGDAVTVFPSATISMVGGERLGSTDATVTLTFGGLSPTKTYTFATSANRAGGTSYANRLTTFTISGIDSATNTSSSGTTTTTTTTTFSTGENTTTGYIARWENINPGTDGVFTIEASDASTTNYPSGPAVFLLSEEVSGPTISTSGTLSAFTAALPSISAEQSFNVSAASLTADLVITAPADFEISTTPGSGFGSTVTLTPSGGTVASTPIYARFTRSTPGTSSGNITLASAGATTVNVAVSGTAAVYYTLSVNAGSNGTVTLNPAGGSYASGTTVTLTATGNSGYGFYAWSGDLSGNTNPTTIVMDGNKSVSATFVAQVCNQIASVTATEDTYLSAAATALNYGSSAALEADLGTSTTRRGILLRWDLSSAIPTNATVTAVNLQLTVSTASGGTSTATYYLYNMRQSWVEGEGTSTGTTGSGASWTYYGAGTGSWGSAGAASTTADRFDTNLWSAGTSSFSSAGTKTLALNTYGVSAVQAWVTNPTSNNGLTIQNYTGSTNNVLFNSSEYSTAANRPILAVTYCAIPTPTITTTGTLSAFSTAVGTPSAEQSYTVSGVNLTAPIVITPPAGFEISLTSGGGFVSNPSTLSLTPASGTVASTTIYARLTGAAAGSFSGNITHASTGATTKNVAASGTVTQYYILTVNAPNGSVALNPTGGSYASGTTVTLTATGNSGYMFSSWSGDLSGSANPTTITMDGNKTVTANFAVAQCQTISMEASADTYMRSGNTKGNYNYGHGTVIRQNPYYKAGSSIEDDQYAGALLMWDLSSISIPTGATVSSASISFYVTNVGENNTYNLYNLRRAWVEGTNGDSGAAGMGASWNYYGAGTGSWTAAGAQDTSLDRYNTNLWGVAVADFSHSGSVIFPLNSNGINVVQDWITTPANNNGLTMQYYNASATVSDVWEAASRDNESFAGPTLNITYCVPISGPTITTSGTLSEFSSTPGAPSAAQTYTVAGYLLTDSLLITAPANFELSTNGTVYSSSLELYQTDGSVPATTIYVRLHSESAGSFSGNLAHTSAGATTVNLAVSGSAQPMFTLTVDTDGHGTVALSPTGGSYSGGTVVTLTPTASSGYDFGHWTGANDADIINTGGVYTILVNDNKSVTAHFYQSSCSTVNLTPSKDTWLHGTSPTNNNGANITLYAHGYSTGRGALMQWDLSGISTSAVVSNASLTIQVTDASATSPGYIYNLYALKRAWVEGTGNATATGDGATFNSYDGNTSHTWETSGAAGTTSDRGSTNLWSQGLISSTGVQTFSLNSDGVGIIQNWVSSPGNNYGLTLQNYLSGSTQDTFGFYSKEGSGTKPTLNISYCTGSSNAPVINTTSSLTAFTSNINAFSAVQSYTVSASYLTADLVLTAPASFQISTTTNNEDFGSTITLPQSGGTVAATTIYIRFHPTSAGTVTGSITHVSSPATQVNVSVSGTATNAAPTLSLVQPADNATGVTTPPTLSVGVTDPNADSSTVSFYGRPAGAGSGQDFTFALIPDPQNLSATIFNAQTQWIVDHKNDAGNPIVFATTTGDMVNTSSVSSNYQLPDAAIDILDAGGVWYSVAPGNHDTAMGATFYGDFFGASRYSSHLYANGGWFGGSYDNYNTYSLFSAGGMDFILINLQYSPSTAVISWADQLLTTYSNRRAIVEQHDILNINNSWNNQTSYNTLRSHSNLFLMLCGHMHSTTDGAAYLAGTGTDGHTIHIVLADYQDMTAGYLRLLRFSPTTDTITMTTYSPYTGGSLTSTSNYDQANLAYDMVSSVAYSLIGTAEDVPSWSNASVSWTGLSNSTEYEWYAVANDGTVDTISSTWSFTTGTIVTNQPPVITENDPQAVSMSEDNAPTPFSLTLHATDANSGDTLTWSVNTDASHGTATASGTGASIAVGYAPTANYNGADSFVVQVSDGNGGTDTITVNVTIIAVNDPPVANAQSVTVTEDTPQPVTLTGSDVENATLTFSIVTEPAHGDLTGVIPNQTYAPDLNYNGEDSFTFSVYDGELYSAAATVSIMVNAEINVAPVIAQGASVEVTMSEDSSPLAFGVVLSAADANTGDTLSWSRASAASHGAATVSGSGASPTVTYAPEGNYNGADSFIVQVADNHGGADTITVNVTINAVNDAPVAAAQAVTARAGASTAITLSGSDVENATLTYQVDAGPTHGTLSGTAPNLSYAADFAYSGADSFTFHVSDGELSSPAGTVSITVNIINSAPTASDGTAATDEDTPVAITLNAADPDVSAGDAVAQYEIVAGPTHGALSNLTLNTRTYTPSGNYHGSDSFTFRAADRRGAWSAAATVTITIASVNDDPVLTAIGDYDVDEGSALAFTASAADADLPGDTLTYSLIDASAGAAINGSTGAFTWTPTEAQGPDDYTFTVRVCDVAGACDSETSTISVAEINTAPVLASIANRAVAEEHLLAFTATATDADLPATALLYSLVDAPTGAAIVPATGAFTWTPTADQGPAEYSFDVRVCDAGGLCDFETITVTVTLTLQSYSVSLTPGWNLVSFNLHPISTDVEDVLASLNGSFDLVYAWDASGAHSGDGNWMKFDNAELSADSLTSLDETTAFWIRMTAADVLEISGTAVPVASISLSNNAGGWNLVAYPSATNGDLPAALTQHGVTAFSIVYAFDTADTEDPWKLYDPFAAGFSNDLTQLLPGLGYWIRVSANQTWTVAY